MADINQFGSVRPSQSADAKVCSQFEAMLTEAVDGTLSAEEQATLDLHLAGCAGCSEMLADARRGAAWMEMLRHRAPEPPAAMVERILAQTSGAQSGIAGLPATAPALAMGAAGTTEAGPTATGNVIPFRKRTEPRFDLRGVGHTLLQPRLAMTAAMAFFSIALTMNLTGIRLSELRASDLKPSSLKRSIYEANAHVVRYYTNLRVVYELESRVHDLQRSSDDDLSRTPATINDGAAGRGDTEPAGKKKNDDPDSQPKRRVSPGTSRREPLQDDRRVFGVLAARGQWPTGEPAMDTFALLLPGVDLPSQERGTV